MPDRYIKRLNGPRGTALLAAAWVAVAHAIGYLPIGGVPAVLPSGLQLISDVIPLWVYAVLWACASCVAVIGAFTTSHGYQRDRWDAAGFGACVGMLVVWGSTYLLGWSVTALTHGVPSRQWLVGGLYVGVAVILSASARMTNPHVERR